MSTVRAWRSSSTSSPGNAARASSRRVCRRDRARLWPGVGATRTTSRSRPKCRSAASRERDVPLVRRVERAAEQPGHAQLERLVADLDLVARPRARRRAARARAPRPRAAVPAIAEAAVGAEDAVAALARLRPVDEELGEALVVGSGGDSLRRRRARTGRAGTRRCPRRSRTRRAKTRDDRAGRRSRTAAAPAAGRACSARRPAAARRGRRRTPPARGRSSWNCSAGSPVGRVDHVRRAAARARGARGTRGRARRPRSRPRSGPGRRRR